MGKSKITPAQIYIIGVVLTVIAGVVIYFAMIKPADEKYQADQARLDTATATANKMPDAKKARKKAEEAVASANRDWAVYDKRFMPDINISNLLKGIQQLWHEQVMVLQPKVQNYLLADKKVQIVQANLAVPAPPSDPNAVAKKAFVYDLGSVSVAGTFNDVLNNATRWNSFDRLVEVDNLVLQGNSPRLVGTYSLRCYEFTHGDTPGPNVPQAAPASGGGFSGAPGAPGAAPGDEPPGGPGAGVPGRDL